MMTFINEKLFRLETIRFLSALFHKGLNFTDFTHFLKNKNAKREVYFIRFMIKCHMVRMRY